ncbi:UPF0175 family protein [Candidatus Electrothrix sp.]|uniref:UPF0175 family protein n=1 Tax=Candidatus Electrothrix sp. TaxID=2170559 RepID=UPI004056A668
MNTQSISVNFPADILLALNETENELRQRICFALAVQLYKTQKLPLSSAINPMLISSNLYALQS